MSDIIIRVISQAGRSRVEINSNKQFKDLKDEIAGRLGVQSNSLKMFKDQGLRQPVTGKDTDTIAKVGLKHGDIIHIANADTKMQNLPPPKKELKTAEEIDKEKAEKEKDAPMKDSFGRVIKTMEKVEDTVAKDSFGRVIKEAPKEEKPKDVKMIQDGKSKKEDDESDKFVKHQSFENYIVERKKKCMSKHLPHERCQDRLLVDNVSYKVKKNCPEGHRPYPQGMCNKCLPPAVVLMR